MGLNIVDMSVESVDSVSLIDEFWHSVNSTSTTSFDDVTRQRNATFASGGQTLTNLPTIWNLVQEVDRPGGGVYADLFRVLVPLLFGFTCILGMTGNAVVVYVIASNFRRKSPRNVLLLNLAAADLLLLPTFAVIGVVGDFRWPLVGGDDVIRRRLSGYLVRVTSCAAVYAIVSIAVLRYMTLVHNKRTARLRNHRNAGVVIATAWCAALVVNAPTTTMPTSSSFVFFFCGVHFVVAYVLPLAALLALSAAMFRYIRRRRGGGVSPGGVDKGARRASVAGRLLVLASVVFAVLWLPVHVNMLLDCCCCCCCVDGVVFASNSSVQMSMTFADWMACFNSCLNPVIYNHTSREFRKDLRKAVGCCCCCDKRKQTRTQKIFFI